MDLKGILASRLYYFTIIVTIIMMIHNLYLRKFPLVETGRDMDIAKKNLYATSDSKKH
jgi:hypothetical protein